MTATNIILAITATTTALIAGLFYSWSCSVTLGLAQVPDEHYISAMQQINKAIQNPVFFTSFLGTALLLPLSAYLNYVPGSLRFILLLTAALLYLGGTFAVTIAGNVPMNNTLDAFNLHAATAEQMKAFRVNYEKPWNNLNTIRTITSILSLILVIIACMSPMKSVIMAE